MVGYFWPVFFFADHRGRIGPEYFNLTVPCLAFRLILPSTEVQRPEEPQPVVGRQGLPRRLLAQHFQLEAAAVRRGTRPADRQPRADLEPPPAPGVEIDPGQRRDQSLATEAEAVAHLLSQRQSARRPADGTGVPRQLPLVQPERLHTCPSSLLIQREWYRWWPYDERRNPGRRARALAEITRSMGRGAGQGNREGPQQSTRSD